MTAPDQNVSVPWKSWYGDEALSLSFSPRWQVRVASMADGPGIDDAAIEGAIRQPIGSPPLRDLAAAARTACICIDDLTRPTQAWRIAPTLIDELMRGGLPAEGICFLVANGAHRPQTLQDQVKKLGPDLVRRFVVHNHSIYDNLVTGLRLDDGAEVQVNRFFAQADLKIAIGSILPHAFTGFSGGGKMVVPAVCGADAIDRHHRGTMTAAPARVGELTGNNRRQEIDRLAVGLGLTFIVNTVPNARNETADVVAGHPVGAFAEGVRRAQKVFATDVPYHSDIAVFNAYPKDTELLTSAMALNVWAEREDQQFAVVRPGGAIVMICAATEGFGWHELIGPGMRMYASPDRRRNYASLLENRNLLVLCPTVGAPQFHQFYPREAEVFPDWDAVRRRLEQLQPGPAQVTVFPNSAIQVDSRLG